MYKCMCDGFLLYVFLLSQESKDAVLNSPDIGSSVDVNMSDSRGKRL